MSSGFPSENSPSLFQGGVGVGTLEGQGVRWIAAQGYCSASDLGNLQSRIKLIDIPPMQNPFKNKSLYTLSVSNRNLSQIS